MPFDLFLTVRHAYQVLDWHENLREKEIPPEWMWTFDEEINDWFEEVKAEREREFSSPTEGEGDEGMLQNEYAKGRR